MLLNLRQANFLNQFGNQLALMSSKAIKLHLPYGLVLTVLIPFEKPTHANCFQTELEVV